MIWHYTKGMHLPKIIASGEIRQATAGVRDGERPIVWFSVNPVWEWTVNPVRAGLPVSFDEMGLLFGGRARIGVDDAVARLNWNQLKRLAGIHGREARWMEETAIRRGASSRDWRGSFDAVPRDFWLSVEVVRDGAWVPFENGNPYPHKRLASVRKARRELWKAP